jgi:hypothetical protein
MDRMEECMQKVAIDAMQKIVQSDAGTACSAWRAIKERDFRIHELAPSTRADPGSKGQ